MNMKTSDPFVIYPLNKDKTDFENDVNFTSFPEIIYESENEKTLTAKYFGRFDEEPIIFCTIAVNIEKMKTLDEISIIAEIDAFLHYGATLAKEQRIFLPGSYYTFIFYSIGRSIYDWIITSIRE